MVEVSVYPENPREQRGKALFFESGHEIRKIGPQLYLVPGCSADFYKVDLRAETCNCPDFEHRCKGVDGLLCKHIYAAVLHREKVERDKLRCDYRFLELLEEDYGIRQFHLRSAFMGVPAARKLDAIAVCERATAEANDPEDAGEIVRQWAKDRMVGSYHPAITGAPPLTFDGRTGYELEGV